MRHRAVALFAGMLVLGVMPGPALAGGGGDQGSAGHGGGYCGPKTFAQTVTTGVAGKLDAVDLYLYEATGNNIQVTIAPLYRGGGIPTGPALAVSSSVTVQKENWYHFTFPAPYSFLVGGKFAIVFSMTGNGSCAGGAGADPYPGGTAMQLASNWTVMSGVDFAFATWVTPGTAPTAVPVPTAPGQLVTQPPMVTPAPTQKAVPAATVKPAATALPAPSKLGASPVSTELVALATADSTAPATADSAALQASASPGAATEPQSGSPSDSGSPPILLIIGGIVALAAVLGGGIGLGLLLARRQQGAPPAG